MVKGEPVPTRLPPLDASYQSIAVPAALDAESVTDPVPHLEAPTGFVAAAGTAFTVAVTAVLVDDTHPVDELRACA